MGTVGYMSPEQVKGLAADHRSDLFSFGADFYEMLSGNRAFHGDSSVETMSAILKQDPPELAETNRTVPPALGRIVRHCLEKNPEERFQSARDVAFALGALSDSSSAATGAVTAGARRAWRPMGARCGRGGAAGYCFESFTCAAFREAPAQRTAVRFFLRPAMGSGRTLRNQPRFLPTGSFLRSLPCVTDIRNSGCDGWMRSEAQPIAGSEDAANPFWSPDSRYIAFFVSGQAEESGRFWWQQSATSALPACSAWAAHGRRGE